MGLGVGVLAASRNVLRRFIVIWVMPLRMSSALRMILGGPMPARKVSRTNMGLGFGSTSTCISGPMPGRNMCGI